MANDVDVNRKSAYELYAEQAGGGPSFVGDLLKFDKFGTWRAGQEEREVPLGTRLIVGVQTLQIGWIKWWEGKPVVQNMVLVEDIDSGAAEMPPLRNALGDDDPALWEQDDKGVPIDPWVFTNSIVLLDPEDNQLYTFSTRSKGGIGAIGSVIKAYIPHSKITSGEVPVVALGNDSYPHAKYGKIMIPRLLVEGWVEMPDAILEARSNDVEEPQQKVAPKKLAAPAAKNGAAKSKAKVTVTPPPRGQKRNGPQKGARF